MDQIDFSDFFTTKAEANDFFSRLTVVTDKIFQTDFNLHKALSDQFGINKSDKLVALLRENNVSVESQEQVKTFLQKLQERIMSLPVLSLTIAFEPQEQTLKSLSEWFLINLKKQVVFDIKVDYKLVAGAAINFNGKFFAFSIRPLVEKTLETYLARLTQANKPQPTHQRVDDISLGR
jgi:F0F1-type ATP synthase delta subunit